LPPPCVLPFWPVWLEVPGWLGLSEPKPMRPKPCWMFPRAKTPATTSTTAPATARAGRNQAIAVPTGLPRRLAAVLAGVEAVAMLSRDFSAPPSASWAADVSGARSVTSERDRILLKRDSHRTTTNQRSTVNSLRSSHHCRLSHGSPSRARIFVKPSPTGSN